MTGRSVSKAVVPLLEMQAKRKPLAYEETVINNSDALQQHLLQNRKDPRCRVMYVSLWSFHGLGY